MILAVDHLAWNVAALDPAVAGLAAEGWTCRFREPDLANAAEKAPFLRAPAPRHGIALLRRPPAPQLEVTCHGAQAAPPARHWRRQGGRIGLNAAAPAREAEFLVAGLGFAAEDGVLRLASPLPGGGGTVEIAADAATPEQGWLDDDGCTCLALIANRIDEDLARCRAAGARDVSAVFTLTVGGRQLAIALLRTPGGAPLELIQPVRAPVGTKAQP